MAHKLRNAALLCILLLESFYELKKCLCILQYIRFGFVADNTKDLGNDKYQDIFAAFYSVFCFEAQNIRKIQIWSKRPITFKRSKTRKAHSRDSQPGVLIRQAMGPRTIHVSVLLFAGPNCSVTLTLEKPWETYVQHSYL